jgi:hypothetical protein
VDAQGSAVLGTSDLRASAPVLATEGALAWQGGVGPAMGRRNTDDGEGGSARMGGVDKGRRWEGDVLPAALGRGWSAGGAGRDDGLPARDSFYKSGSGHRGVPGAGN